MKCTNYITNNMCILFIIFTTYFLIKQVQLLVSDADVESYKQIKSDLDVLRQSVEKSELWVYKSNKMSSTTENQQQHNETPSMPAIQMPTTFADVVEMVTTASLHSTIPTPPLVMKNTTPGNNKESNEKPSNDGSCGEVEEDDDEYKKIQKVMLTIALLFIKYFNLILIIYYLFYIPRF